MDPKTKTEKVHDVFESISDRYDRMNSVISFRRHRAWRKSVMKQMDVKEGSTCLDVACGTGDWTIALGEATGSKGKVYGLDFSENMLSVGRKKVEASNLNHIELVHGNAMELPYSDNEFDYVTIGFGLRNMPDYEQVLSEMYRVVKPGGQVVCLETSQPTMPVYKQIYFFYFKNIMPLFGKMIAKNHDAYSWLNESTVDFPDKQTLKKMFLDAGFQKVIVKSYALGAAAMHLGVK